MTSPSDLLDVRGFRQHLLEYRWNASENLFRHNYGRDLHVFIIWQEARSHAQRIIEGLGEDFTIQHTAEIQWSQKKIHNNAARLYRRIYDHSGHVPDKIGDGRFHVVVVEDDDPIYVYDRVLSGRIEFVNRKVADHKHRYRKWVDGYGVHASDSLGDFFEQASLLFGRGKLRLLLNNGPWDGEVEVIRSDLAGAYGWSNITEMFEILNLASNHVMLRAFEAFPPWEVPSEGDLDVLCDDLSAFVSAVNGRLVDVRRRSSKTVVRIAGVEIPVDVRYVGDGYYDSRWQVDTLRHQVDHQGLVARPRGDDYFFSLLYHAKLQKSHVKAEYIELLPQLAHSIGLEWFTAEDVLSDQAAADVLSGFLEGRGYTYVKPVDTGVRTNSSVLRLLSPDAHPPEAVNQRFLLRLGIMARWLAPRQIRALVPERWKRWLARHVRLR